ncbi:hypothetical protein [Celeribacter naphthalenivorans]|uniref:hypothetical protein n=1 Tax=Celeribacter naphthalenivorans TaxID=1614694 RepID=UPI001CFBEC5B|nr:hypothetical protein [Celeribacter naphthalenivorans]
MARKTDSEKIEELELLVGKLADAIFKSGENASELLSITLSLGNGEYDAARADMKVFHERQMKLMRTCVDVLTKLSMDVDVE